MGSIFQDKKTGRWRGVVNLPKGPDGSRKQKTFYGDTSLTVSQQKKELQVQITNLEYEINNNLYLNETNETMEQYLKSWLKVYASENLEDTTRQLYEMYVKVHINPFFGNIKVREIQPMKIQEFYNEKAKDIELENGKIKKGLSKNTIGKLHSFLNRAFDDAMKNQKIKINPCQSVKRPKKKKYTPTVYNEENFNRLTALTQGTFDEVCILLAGVCGLRRGEIFGLRLVDVDFKGCRISITETLVRMNGDWLVKGPKSESGQRTIRIPRFVIEVISDYMKSLKIVPERVCGQFKPSSYSQHFKKLLEDNNLPHIRLHDLRHFNASLMMHYGVPDKIAADRLGHSQIQMTRQYQHSSSEMDNEASLILEEVFNSKKSGTRS